MLTDGAVRLAQLVRPAPMNSSELADKLGVSRQSVSKWLAGKSMPSVEAMAKIEDLTGIPMRAWAVKSGKLEP